MYTYTAQLAGDYTLPECQLFCHVMTVRCSGVQCASDLMHCLQYTIIITLHTIRTYICLHLLTFITMSKRTGVTNENRSLNHHTANDSDSDSDNCEQLQYKICILGDGAVGKTSITNRFSVDSYTATYKQTIGIDFYIKHIVINNNINIALQLWDIGGQNLASQNLQHYIYGAHVILICYDITNYQSYCDVDDWFQLIHSIYQQRNMMIKLPYIALVGNKCDLLHLSAVKQDKIDSYCLSNNLPQFLVSAKTGECISTMFYKIASELTGVQINKQLMESISNQIQIANVVNYTQHDTQVNKIDIEQEVKKSSKKQCTVM